ncbi:MAG: MFS transporter [Bdellovibrio sp.]|nr:MFS transporter [Bdellovibrio sp.]
MGKAAKSPLIVIFTTVMVDLIGFGMVIPLIGLYGRHYGADGFDLAILGGIYSLMQFFFAPIWGALSDRMGRRPIILLSLLGSTLSYVIFAFAPSYLWLLIARAFGGIFAANISTAQAYIADVTLPEDRARGMGLIGAAFGIGFTLGPPLGGIASAKLGLEAPGLIAALICGTNFLLAIWRLPESLSPELKKSALDRSLSPIRWEGLKRSFANRQLGFFLFTFFVVTFAFSTMEQTFSLLFQTKFNLETGEAGLKTGLVLMVAGIIGALVQGGMIRSLVKKFGEVKLLIAGLFLNALSMALFPYGATYMIYFFLTIPLALGSGLINPSLAALISKSAAADKQGTTLGLSQGLGSLARATGPFCGLLTFAVSPQLPYLIATLITLALLGLTLSVRRSKSYGNF